MSESLSIISISNDEAFVELKMNFDKILQNTICYMREKGSTTGDITMKMSIEMLEACLQAFAAGTKEDVCGVEKVYKLNLKHKFTSVVQVKKSVEGKTDKEVALVWDEEQKIFVQRILAECEQLTLDTYETAQKAFDSRSNQYTYAETNGVVETINFNKKK